MLLAIARTELMLLLEPGGACVWPWPLCAADGKGPNW